MVLCHVFLQGFSAYQPNENYHFIASTATKNKEWNKLRMKTAP